MSVVYQWTISSCSHVLVINKTGVESHCQIAVVGQSVRDSKEDGQKSSPLELRRTQKRLLTDFLPCELHDYLEITFLIYWIVSLALGTSEI